MQKHTREWLEYLAENKNNSKAKEIINYIKHLEGAIDDSITKSKASRTKQP